MVEGVVECSREDNWAIPIKDVKDSARPPVMSSSMDYGKLELEGGVDSEDDLEDRKGFRKRVILKDMFTANGKKKWIVRTVREKVGTSEGRVSKGSRDVGVLNCSEVSVPPECQETKTQPYFFLGPMPLFPTTTYLCSPIPHDHTTAYTISKIVPDMSDLMEVARSDQLRYRQIPPAVVLILQILPDTLAMSTECDFHGFPMWSPSEPLTHATCGQQQKSHCYAPSFPNGRDEHSICYHKHEKRVEQLNRDMHIPLGCPLYFALYQCQARADLHWHIIHLNVGG